MKALTLDAYWAWAIIHGPKRVENRTWRTRHRGPLAIHAGRNRSRDADAIAFLRDQGLNLPTAEQIERLRGRVLGVVEVVDCVEYHEPALTFWPRPSLLQDPYAFGPICWVLDRPRPCEPVEVTGKQGLWELDDRLISRPAAPREARQEMAPLP